jgi:predicted Zn-dependent protease
MTIKYPVILTIIIIITVLASSGCFESSDEKVLGDNAKGYLQDKKYKRLIVEVDYVKGFFPSSEVLDTLRNRINFYCDKDQVLIFKDEIPKSQSSYALDDIKKLEKEHRDYKTSGSDIVAYFIYLNGFYSDDSNVLGIAYSPSSIAIFKEKIYEINIPIWAASQLEHVDYERSVVVHELGHILALVNIGYESSRNHESSHNNHCKFKDCVMYYAIETASIIDLITQEDPKPPSDFGNDCRHDLSNLKSGVY